VSEQGFPERHVVTSFLVSAGRVLILRRSDAVGTYQGHWAGVAGYLEPGVTPLEQALTEIREETGLEARDVRLVKAGETETVDDSALGRRWIIHPFRFEALEPANLRLDWEHTELRWIKPAEMGSYQCVPGLAEAWRRVAS
jgi:8-oxo-dGTP diphosphatase